MSNQVFSAALGQFRCPHCGLSFSLKNGTLRCENRHTFDRARQGYVNFLTRPVSNEYDRPMLESRRQVISSDFFTPLLQQLAKRLPQKGWVLDAGCGEGSQLHWILKACPALSGIGIDLSKDGVLLAARSYPTASWAVADLAAPPLHSHRFDGILNILSPANYEEFSRLLTADGVLLKVIPNTAYLQELRQLLLPQDSQPYSNQQSKELFFAAYPNGISERVRYQFSLSPRLLPHLLAMTPLSWNIPAQRLSAITADQLPQVTADFTFLIGGPKYA